MEANKNVFLKQTYIKKFLSTRMFNHYIKKIVRRRNHDVEILKRRLDKHGDDWRSVPMVVPHPKGKTEQKRRGPKPKNKQAADGTGAPGSEPGSNPPVPRKPRKQKAKPPTATFNPIVPPPHPQPQLGT